jgi:hypothetical protein
MSFFRRAPISGAWSRSRRADPTASSRTKRSNPWLFRLPDCFVAPLSDDTMRSGSALATDKDRAEAKADEPASLFDSSASIAGVKLHVRLACVAIRSKAPRISPRRAGHCWAPFFLLVATDGLRAIFIVVTMAPVWAPSSMSPKGRLRRVKIFAMADSGRTAISRLGMSFKGSKRA